MRTRGYCGVSLNVVGNGKVLANASDKWEVLDYTIAAEGFDTLLKDAEDTPVYMLWWSFPLVTGEIR